MAVIDEVKNLVVIRKMKQINLSLSDEIIIEKFIKYANWKVISKKHSLTEDFIETFHHKLDWVRICTYQNISESFIEKNSDKIHWECLGVFQKFSSDFIVKHEKKLNFHTLIRYQKLDDYILDFFNSKIDWFKISYYQKLSINIIKRNIHKLNLVSVYKYHNLSYDDFVDNYFFIKEDLSFLLLFYNLKINKQTKYQFLEFIYKMDNYYIFNTLRNTPGFINFSKKLEQNEIKLLIEITEDVYRSPITIFNKYRDNYDLFFVR